MRFYSLVVLAVVASNYGFAAAAKPPSAEISSTSTEFGSDEPVIVKLKIRNQNNQKEAKILQYKTIEPPDYIDNLEENVFDVVLEGGNGLPSQYLGPHVKRPSPTSADYLVLNGGGQLTKKVDLANFYDFTETGLYTIMYSASDPKLFDDSNPGSSLVSNTLTIYVEGRPKRVPPSAETEQGNGNFKVSKGPGGGGGGTPAPSCSGSQQAIISEALTHAVSCSGVSQTYMTGLLGTPSSVYPRYEEWFGAADTTRFNLVSSQFGSIFSTLNSGNVAWNCKCKQNYYAYVYPNDASHTIYPCKVFWQTTTTGTDSRMGTTIHEASHFNDVAGTDDVVYGQSGCRSLADNNPNGAVRNADSHEYFCENTPNLSRA